MRRLITCLVLLLVSAGYSQWDNPTYITSQPTGVWGNVTYTPSSFPRANYCNCAMCQSLRAQWSANRVTPVVQAPQAYRLETRTRQVPRKICINGVCRIEYVTETYQVKVPVKQSYTTQETVALLMGDKPKDVKTELVSTPTKVVKAILASLEVTKGSTLVDVGCGNGVYLIEAAKLECKAIGLEINHDSVKLARKNIAAAQLSEQAKVLCINGEHYDYSEVDYITMWLYPEDMTKIIKRVAPGTKVASYMHSLPTSKFKDIDMYEGTIDGKLHKFYIGTKI